MKVDKYIKVYWYVLHLASIYKNVVNTDLKIKNL